MTEIRRVYFGDRNMPEADRVPGRNGYSSGHWEGDTLVVETDNLVDQVDQRSTSHSDQATIVERYQLDGKDAQGRRILAVEMTMTDPVFYTKPVVIDQALGRGAEWPRAALRLHRGEVAGPHRGDGQGKPAFPFLERLTAITR